MGYCEEDVRAEAKRCLRCDICGQCGAWCVDISRDESWKPFRGEYVGCRGIIVDPDTSVNDPDVLIEIRLEGKGTHRFPQDCIRMIDR